jgi:hypothetical protein
MLRHKVVSLVLAILFVFSAHFFFKAYEAYVAERHALKLLTSHREGLEDRRNEQAEKRRIFGRVGVFMDRARQMGMVSSQWRHYDVNIETSLSFEETADILAETVTTDAYYFKPRLLHVKRASGAGEENDTGRQESMSGQGQGLEGKDLQLTLRGAFVVRNQ